jgi:hypothetical protein
MNETAIEANKLWGVYHTDREYARTVGDPLRSVVEAPTKLAAEGAAVRTGHRNDGPATSRNPPRTLPQ